MLKILNICIYFAIYNYLFNHFKVFEKKTKLLVLLINTKYELIGYILQKYIM